MADKGQKLNPYSIHGNKYYRDIDIKTFIQKVKEDIRKIGLTEWQLNPIVKINKIIDKRTGDLK